MSRAAIHTGFLALTHRRHSRVCTGCGRRYCRRLLSRQTDSARRRIRRRQRLRYLRARSRPAHRAAHSRPAIDHRAEHARRRQPEGAELPADRCTQGRQRVRAHQPDGDDRSDVLSETCQLRPAHVRLDRQHDQRHDDLRFLDARARERRYASKQGIHRRRDRADQRHHSCQPGAGQRARTEVPDRVGI